MATDIFVSFIERNPYNDGFYVSYIPFLSVSYRKTYDTDKGLQDVQSLLLNIKNSFNKEYPHYKQYLYCTMKDKDTFVSNGYSILHKYMCVHPMAYMQHLYCNIETYDNDPHGYMFFIYNQYKANFDYELEVAYLTKHTGEYLFCGTLDQYERSGNDYLWICKQK